MGSSGSTDIEAMAAARGGVPGRIDDVREQPGLLLVAEHAVDVGAELLRRGRAHIGGLIGKGDRDFATDVDVRIEAAIGEALSEATPDIPVLGEEGGGPDLTRAWSRAPAAGASLSGARLAVAEVPGLREAIVGISDFEVGAGIGGGEPHPPTGGAPIPYP